MAKAPQTLSAPAIIVKNRAMLTVAVMLGTVMQVLDTTIANVALPNMSASLGAAQNEITWVLTSYIVAAAIATPVTGWLSDQIGQKRLFVISVVGFTVASLLCGVATSLDEMVLFRLVQGICGAFIAPLAQMVILNINPRERIGQAMAIYGAGIMIGPIVGPSLGGWLTETLNWRWVFLVNLPIGVLCVSMLLLYMPKTELKQRPFDFFGFGMLALGVGALQLMLDRGADNDWFNSAETWIELGLVITGFWVFIVHCATAKHPFVDLKIFKDRNFSMGLVFMFIIGITLFSGLALLPPMLQNLMGYPVITTGIVMAPRGVGTMVSMILVGRLVGKFDPRVLVLFGLGLMAYSFYMMAGFNPNMDSTPIVTSGLVQGFGMGFVFVPLSTVTFATIDSKYRGDGTALFALVRNMGSGVGISMVTAVLANMMQVNHLELGERLTATTPAVINQIPSLLTGNGEIVSLMDQYVSLQAGMVSYVDDFLLMMYLSIAAVPIVLLFKGKAKASSAPKKTPEELALERAHAMAE
ncbi:MAG TPA: DHA2 family efflux MFS transporter permease subunit [Devosiaceae bacterium]|nr:DHA2 family efflux MFS transporter permease subunit [Devosiaceae bacterium]